MSVAYLSPHLSCENSGGTLVAKSNLLMLVDIFDKNVICYSVNRNPMASTVPIATTKSTLGTGWANVRGLCATLNIEGKRHFLAEIKKTQPKIVWLDTSLFGALIDDIRLIASKSKIICYSHNVEIDLVTQRLSKGHIHYVPSFLATYLNERQSMQKSDAVACITDIDQSRINQLYGRKDIYSLPVSLTRSDGMIPPRIESNQVIFVGSDFGPNIEGLIFLNNKVAPLLKSKRILVVGKGLGRHIQGYVHPRIELLGFVEDISEVYARASVSLAPIFSGGGMKVKIAESLMYACPVIATTFAAIGYERAGRDSVLRVNSAQEFATAIEECKTMSSTSASNDFENHYSFKANLSRLENILSKI